MATYKEKLQTENHVGGPPDRCPSCHSPLKSNSLDKGLWIPADLTGSVLGGVFSTHYGLKAGIPYFQKHVKGPIWFQIFLGVTPLFMLASAGSKFGEYALLKITRLHWKYYYAASSASSPQVMDDTDPKINKNLVTAGW